MNTPIPRFLRYIISGSIAAVVDIGSLYVLVGIFHIWYLLSATIAFILTLMASFALQKFWTFNENSTDVIGSQFGAYLTLSIANIFVNMVLMYLFVDVFGAQYLFAQTAVIAIMALYGFFIYKHWIFRSK